MSQANEAHRRVIDRRVDGLGDLRWHRPCDDGRVFSDGRVGRRAMPMTATSHDTGIGPDSVEVAEQVTRDPSLDELMKRLRRNPHELTREDRNTIVEVQRAQRVAWEDRDAKRGQDPTPDSETETSQDKETGDTQDASS